MHYSLPSPIFKNILPHTHTHTAWSENQSKKRKIEEDAADARVTRLALDGQGQLIFSPVPLSKPSPSAVLRRRPRQAPPPRLLRREGEVPHGSRGRLHSSALQRPHRRRLRLRPRSSGQELHLESGYPNPFSFSFSLL